MAVITRMLRGGHTEINYISEYIYTLKVRIRARPAHDVNGATSIGTYYTR